MAWVAVHKNGDEVIFDFEPYKGLRKRQMTSTQTIHLRTRVL